MIVSTAFEALLNSDLSIKGTESDIDIEQFIMDVVFIEQSEILVVVNFPFLGRLEEVSH